MRSGLVNLAACTSAVLLVMATGMEQAAAQRGHGGSGPALSASGGGGAARSSGGAGRSFSGGGRSIGSGRSLGSRSFGGNSGTRVYGYTRRGGRGHARHFRGGRAFLYGAPAAYGVYSYARSCDYYYRRALASGSDYWWDRYYACTGDDD